MQDPAIRGTGGTGVLPTVVFTEAVFPVAILPIDDSDVVLSSSRRCFRSTSNSKWLRKSAPMIDFATSAMTKFRWNASRRSKSRQKVLIPIGRCRLLFHLPQTFRTSFS